MLLMTGPETIRRSPLAEGVVGATVVLCVHGTVQALTASCRPLFWSVVRLLEVATLPLRVTEPSGRVPLLTRFTARVTESPGTKPAVVTGTVAPAEVTSMSSVPESMVVLIGVLLSVKVPKVPMPATAAAAPMTPSEPTTLRAVVLAARFEIVVLMSLCLPVSGSSTGRFRRQGELWELHRRAPASVPQGMRKESREEPQTGGPGKRDSPAPVSRAEESGAGRISGTGLCARSAGGAGERHREGRALAFGADEVQRAAVGDGDGLGNRQAEPHPGDGVALSGRGSEEAGEELSLLAGRDAHPGVADGESGHRDRAGTLVGAHLAVRGDPDGAQRQGHPAAGRRELDGVGDE